MMAFLKTLRFRRGKLRVFFCAPERSGIAGSFMASNESKVLGMDFIAVPMAFLCILACSVGDAFSDGSEIMGAGVGSMEGAVSLKIVGSCGSKKSSSSSASSSIPN